MITPVILAAGSATRMGSNKLLADLGGKPVLLHVVDSLAEAGLPPPLVITAHAEVNMMLARRPATILSLAGQDPAMGRSLAAAALAMPRKCDAMLVCLGDMPLIEPGTYAKVAAAAEAARIIRPVLSGAAGHPVCWGAKFFGRLARLGADSGGRELIRANPEALLEIEIDDPGMLFDVDTPENLEEAHARLKDNMGD